MSFVTNKFACFKSRKKNNQPLKDDYLICTRCSKKVSTLIYYSIPWKQNTIEHHWNLIAFEFQRSIESNKFIWLNEWMLSENLCETIKWIIHFYDQCTLKDVHAKWQVRALVTWICVPLWSSKRNAFDTKVYISSTSI